MYGHIENNAFSLVHKHLEVYSSFGKSSRLHPLNVSH